MEVATALPPVALDHDQPVVREIIDMLVRDLPADIQHLRDRRLRDARVIEDGHNDLALDTERDVLHIVRIEPPIHTVFLRLDQLHGL